MTRCTSLPVSVVVVTKNEERQIKACLKTLNDFDDVIVVDSNSTDHTPDIVRTFPHVHFENFTWNGVYPKKRQWILENVQLKYPWVLFIDADERVDIALQRELESLNLDTNTTHAGFFLKARYIYQGQRLNYGLKNNKCALIHKDRMTFPEINDLDIEGMGEIEGHYQPIRKAGFENHKIGQLKTIIDHLAYEDQAAWQRRHKRYANWEKAVRARGVLPQDIKLSRRALKTLFQKLPLKGESAFLHSYILKGGFLDGRAGYEFARTRKAYYDLIDAA